MGIFSKETYSKENYDKAEKDVKKSQNIRDAYADNIKGPDVLRPDIYKDLRWVYNNLVSIANQDRERLKRLYTKGQTEAMALNKEYDHLVAEAQQALKALSDFEKEKLEMHKEGQELEGNQ